MVLNFFATGGDQECSLMGHLFDKGRFQECMFIAGILVLIRDRLLAAARSGTASRNS